MLSPDGIKDLTRCKFGINTGNGIWAELKLVASDGTGRFEGDASSHARPRGWFAKDAIDGIKVVLWVVTDG